MLRSNDPCWCGSGRKYKRCHRLSDLPLQPRTVSPRRDVPPDIPAPDYATTGEPKRGAGSAIQSEDVIARMRVAGRAAAEALEVVAQAVGIGVTTDELDEILHKDVIARGAYPSTLDYRGYKKSMCTSVNEVICHGIPDDRALANGDIVNLDVTLFLDGVHGDTSATYLVGEVHPDHRRLVTVARECMEVGIEAVRPGRPISDIGKAINAHATSNGYSVVRAFGGHGIGESFHTDLHIPHHYERRATRVMEPGMVFTVEPMINEGAWQHLMWDDGWTAVTADGRRSAQFEHMVAVTEDGVEVLTAT